MSDLKFAMKASTRCAVVLIAICSWFAISNHCAFAALAGRGMGYQPASYHRQDADATACPFHSKPTTQQQQPVPVQCCKILRAVVLAKTKSWARDDSKFADVDLHVEKFARVALSHTSQVSLPLDTGPPAAHSFAELILQRSLLTHAPPFLA